GPRLRFGRNLQGHPLAPNRLGPASNAGDCAFSPRSSKTTLVGTAEAAFAPPETTTPRGHAVPARRTAPMTNTPKFPLLSPVLLGLTLAVGASLSGCEKDEAPPPLPTAAPQTTASAPPAQLVIEEET